MGSSKQPIWVDSAKTRTADDVTSIGECDALIKRFARDISEISAQIHAGLKHNRLDRALYYRNAALTALKARRQTLVDARF